MADTFNPKIGKTVLETLTSGMYDDARFIFREYIQNAADQVDQAVELIVLKEKSEGKIEITIDANNKQIIILDNATGVSEKEVLRFLGDVANSQKDSVKQKGFRGIGRLGGLGYCDKLIFETSSYGEPIKSKMTLDAKLLKKIIENRNDNSDAAAALSIITKIEKTTADNNEHFFRVILENVFNEKLLDNERVTEYLSMVTPVPFSSSFTFSEQIKGLLKSRNLIPDEYNVEINGKTLFKGYKNTFIEEDNSLSKLIGVDVVDIRNDEQEIIATCWYGYREFSNTVIYAPAKKNEHNPNPERGIRIRTKNIGIGDESTCKKFFDAERTNLRFIGEIHTISDGFVPNARRDYFTENNTLKQFEKNGKVIFTQENLENILAQTASKLHNRLDEIEKYKTELVRFQKMKGSFDNEATETYHLSRLKELYEKALRAKQVVEKIENKSKTSSKIKILYESIANNIDTTIPSLDNNVSQVSKYDPPKFEKLNENQKDVVLEIFEILEESLDFDLSELI
ncbi:MAG: ATP-binding protein, partial [Sediminibacterium sp.]|nr:ATP-binding protein [Sediminibacterium sp.]